MEKSILSEKLVAILLAVVLCVGLAVPALAAEPADSGQTDSGLTEEEQATILSALTNGFYPQNFADTCTICQVLELDGVALILAHSPRWYSYMYAAIYGPDNDGSFQLGVVKESLILDSPDGPYDVGKNAQMDLYTLVDYVLTTDIHFRAALYIPAEGKVCLPNEARAEGLLPNETLDAMREALPSALYQVYETHPDVFSGYTPETFSQSIRIWKKSELLRGDMNHDDTLTVSDVVLLRKLVLEDPDDRYYIDSYLADMNQNASISVTDVVLLRKQILEQETAG